MAVRSKFRNENMSPDLLNKERVVHTFFVDGNFTERVELARGSGIIRKLHNNKMFWNFN